MTLLARACLALLALCCLSTADGVAAPLKIGITTGAPPYIFSIEEGDGLDPDILRVIITRMGQEATFHYIPYARRAQAIRDGRVDAVTFWSRPQNARCHAAAPYRYWLNALFGLEKKEKPVDRETMQQIGVFRGADYIREDIESAGFAFDDLQTISSLRSAVRMMLHGRLDGFIGDYPSFLYYVQTEPAAADVTPRALTFFRPTPQALCFADKAKADAFTAALEALSQEAPDALTAVTRRYGFRERITPPLER